MTKNIIFVGKPGSGKGTQAKTVAQVLNVPHISTGDIFRHEMATKTPLGLQITDLMNKGQYVPDNLTNEVLLNRITRHEDALDGFILDGYPRTLNQAVFLTENNIPIDYVINFEVSDEEITNRILKRALTSGRSDDSLEIIQQRLGTYEATVPQVIHYYRTAGVLWDVNASLPIGTINKVVLSILNH